MKAQARYTTTLRVMQASRAEGIQLETVEAAGPDQYESEFASMTKAHATSVVILGDVMFTRDSRRLAELGESHRLPSG